MPTRAPDLHTEDAEVREALRAQLVQARVAAGMSMGDVGAVTGHTKFAVHDWETRPANPRISTLQRRARIPRLVLTMTPVGLDGTEDTDTVTFRRLAETATDPTVQDAWWRVLVCAQLRAARRATGRPAAQVAAVMGCSFSALLATEAGRDDPNLATYQRFARALGGRLHLELQPLTTEGA